MSGDNLFELDNIRDHARNACLYPAYPYVFILQLFNCDIKKLDTDGQHWKPASIFPVNLAHMIMLPNIHEERIPVAITWTAWRKN